MLGWKSEHEIEDRLRWSWCDRQRKGPLCYSHLRVVGKRGERHAERGLEKRLLHDLAKQGCGSLGMASGSGLLALADFHPRRRHEDQSLEQPAVRRASVRALPKRLPGFMRFPVITVIEEVEPPTEHLGAQRRLHGNRHGFMAVAMTRGIAHRMGLLAGQIGIGRQVRCGKQARTRGRVQLGSRLAIHAGCNQRRQRRCPSTSAHRTQTGRRWMRIPCMHR